MGDLIVMTRPNRISRGLIAATEGAEILFFTGVRYFRMPEESPASPRDKKRARTLKGKKAIEARRAKLHR